MNNLNIRNFCIIAHIDHGKSTLADRMLEFTNTIEKRKMREQVLDRMDLEREKGITIKLQPVRMNYKDSSGKDYIFNLIDTPGHVDFTYEVSRTLAAVEGALLLVDATKGIQAQTLANLYQAQKQNLDIIPAINKIDLPNAQTPLVKKELAELLKISENEILEISAKTGQNIELLFPEIIKKIKPPKINLESKLKTLIFDSVYDEYRGVVAYVRVIDGKISKNEGIKFIAKNTIDKALEVGAFSPEYIPKDDLTSGEIGYIMTGLKNISMCKVGDTITKADETVEPLVGYKKITPMVYAGVFSKSGQINELREALERLALNDSSLFFEPENSQAFGFGFRCGFLGLLHLEIIKERLVREYDLELIITTPQVDYHTKEVHGRTFYSEPWAKLEVISPSEYIGSIMEFTVSKRGKYKETKYLGDRAILYFEAPLSNIITNYYDRLKSISSGYASMNYEFIDYRDEDLVKMDILIANEIVEPLSRIVHQSELNSVAKNTVARLKNLIPPQMFKVSLQAAVGSKILARENITPMKKNVTGHLYGGDISRKKKLWEKQKKGKKRMESFGKVDIPTDVYVNILKNQ